MGPEGAGPESEETKGPDESKFNQMEVAAQAGGPEAEARRQEMARWADSAGKYAEKASELSNTQSETVARAGYSVENVKETARGVNAHIATKGVNYDEQTTIRADKEGMRVDEQGFSRFDRSPGQFRRNTEPTGQEQAGEEKTA